MSDCNRCPIVPPPRPVLAADVVGELVLGEAILGRLSERSDQDGTGAVAVEARVSAAREVVLAGQGKAQDSLPVLVHSDGGENDFVPASHEVALLGNGGAEPPIGQVRPDGEVGDADPALRNCGHGSGESTPNQAVGVDGVVDLVVVSLDLTFRLRCRLRARYRLAAEASGLTQRYRAGLLRREAWEDVSLAVESDFAQSNRRRVAADAARIGCCPEGDAVVMKTGEVERAEKVLDAAEAALA